MHDPLQRVTHIEEVNSRCPRCVTGFDDEGSATWHARLVSSARRGIDDMVHRAKHPRWIEHGAPGVLQALERHRAGAFMEKNPIDREQCDALAELAYEMGVPEFVEQSSRGG